MIFKLHEIGFAREISKTNVCGGKRSSSCLFSYIQQVIRLVSMIKLKTRQISTRFWNFIKLNRSHDVGFWSYTLELFHYKRNTVNSSDFGKILFKNNQIVNRSQLLNMVYQ